jgi:hypothetical protein
MGEQVLKNLHSVNSSAHPRLDFPGCPSCRLGFDGVYAACLTLFAQIVAGDSWSQISIPFAKKEPWTAPILFFIMMTVSLGVMNLILAVIAFLFHLRQQIFLFDQMPGVYEIL